MGTDTKELQYNLMNARVQVQRQTLWGFREQDFEDRMAFELCLGTWVGVIKAERKLKAHFKSNMQEGDSSVRSMTACCPRRLRDRRMSQGSKPKLQRCGGDRAEVESSWEAGLS